MNEKASSMEDVLKGKPTTGKLLKFALPAIVTSVFACLYGVIDGIFISKVGGNTAFAAVNLVTPIFLIVSSFGLMFGTGGNAIVSKIRGEGNDERARQVFTTLTIAVAVLGVLLTVLLAFFLEGLLKLLGANDEMLPLCMAYGRIIIPFVVCYLFQFYFQSMLVTAGKGMLGFIMTVAAGLVNIAGDSIFVGVLAKTPEAAVSGAAWATAGSLVIAGAIPFFYFLFKNSSCLRLVKPVFDMKTVLATCSNGISEFLSNISGAIMNTVFNSLLMYMVGEKGVAAFGSIGYVNTVFLAVFMGYSIGVAPIIAYKYGSKDNEGLKSVYQHSLLILLVSSVVMVGIAEALANPIASMFSNNDQELFQMTLLGFQIYAISFLFKGFNTFGSSFFTALNNGLISAILSVARALVFSIGTVLILPLIFYYVYGASTALEGIWWSVNYSEALAVVMTFIFLLTNRKRYHYGREKQPEGLAS